MKKILTSFITIIFLVSLCISSNAQSYLYKHYGIEDGLPSSEVYAAFQDSKGYMWFATDAGVSRFNGYEFQNFDVSDGLTDNTVFLITEDNKGRIWFATFNCRLSYFLNDSIYTFEHNDALSKIVKNKTAIQSFNVDVNNNLWIGFGAFGLFKIDASGMVEKIPADPNYTTVKVMLYKDHFSFGKYSILHNFRKSNLDKQPFNSVLSIIDQRKTPATTRNYQFDVSRDRNKSKYSSIIVENLGHSIFYYSHPNLSFISSLEPPFVTSKARGLSFIKNRVASSSNYDGHLWLSVLNQGVYECSITNDSIEIISNYLPKKQVSRVFKDNEGGLWFMTLSEGIYYLASKNLNINSFQGEHINAIEIDSISNIMYALTKDGRLYEKRLGIPNSIPKLIFQSQEGNYALHYDYYAKRLFLGEGLNCNLLYLENGAFYSLEMSLFNEGFKDMLVEAETIYKVNRYGLSIIVKDNESHFTYSVEDPILWCTSLIKNGQTIWIGSNTGIKVYESGLIKNPFSNNKYLSSAITCIDRLNNTTFLIGTKSFGILVIKNDTIEDIISTEDGLPGNIIRNMYVKNNIIWVATNNGLSRIEYSNNGSIINNLTKKQGLISKEITGIISYKNMLYASTPKGIMKINTEKINYSSSPASLMITQFSVNSNKKIINDAITLDYDENFIQIQFQGLNYSLFGNIEYKYRLIGADSNWIKTTQRAVQYPRLPHNKYIFEVRAKNEAGVWSDSQNISFTINPPFWKTWWFITLLIVFWLGFIYTCFKINVLVYNKQIQEEIFNRLLKKLGKQSYLFIEMDKQLIRINKNNILFIEAFKNYVEINLVGKKYLYRSTMANMEKKLSSPNFIRTHRSFIVQKNKIDSIGEDQLKVQNHQIPIGKTYQPKLKKLKDQFFRLNN